MPLRGRETLQQWPHYVWPHSATSICYLLSTIYIM
jgi:hypothetical protein